MHIITSLGHDLRDAARLLVKNPLFTLTATLSIAIGVGATTAMFSVADGLVFRPLPVPDPGRIVTIRARTPEDGPGGGLMAHADYVDLARNVRSVDDLVAYRLVSLGLTQRPTDQPVRRFGMAVSANLFGAMRVPMMLGREFRRDEDQVAGRDAVAILDHDEWLRDFAANADVIGSRIRLGAQEVMIVGVLPRGFSGIDHDVRPAFYVPLALAATLERRPDDRERRDLRTVIVKGRLKPGASLDEARADVQQVAGALSREYPGTNRNRGFDVQTQLEAFSAGAGGSDRRLVTMLLALAALVLVVACANVAGLLASRAPARARDVALRMALGANRGRLIRRFLTESLLLAITGGVGGLVFGTLAIGAFQRMELGSDVPLKLSFALDRRALIVATLVATASAVLSSLLPAWQATRGGLAPIITRDDDGDSRRPRLIGRSTLCAAQVALSLVLVTSATFLYRTFAVELLRGPGHRTDHLVLATVDPTLAGYDDARAKTFYRALIERARALPGTAAAALTTAVPMKGDGVQFIRVAPEGFQFAPGTASGVVNASSVDEHYFSTMAIPMRQGRVFTADDDGTRPPVVIVNETFARRYWPGQNAIGKRVRLDPPSGLLAEVVGIAADSRYYFITEPPLPFVYRSRLQQPAAQATLVVETADDGAATVPLIRQTIAAVDPNVPIVRLRTMADLYASRSVYTSRLIVGTVAVMGVIGLLLAMIGLYGLVAFGVSRRVREIGIRVAVGAKPSAVVRMVIRQGAAATVVGMAAGAAISVAAAGLLRAVFPSSAAVEAVTYAAVVPVLMAVTLLAAYLPARRAARLDPLRSLRAE